MKKQQDGTLLQQMALLLEPLGAKDELGRATADALDTLPRGQQEHIEKLVRQLSGFGEYAHVQGFGPVTAREVLAKIGLLLEDLAED